MNDPVVITGIGIVSNLGIGIAPTLVSLRSKETKISRAEILPTVHDLPVGEIKLTNRELAELALVTGSKKVLPRSVLLAIIAIREAMEMSLNHSASTIDLLYGTTVAGIDLTEIEILKKTNGLEYEPMRFKSHDCGFSSAFLSQYFGMNGMTKTISTACSSAANAILSGSERIQAGLSDCVIAGGSDALSLFTLNGFNALMILDKQICKPLDANRKGLNLGEGAAFLVLESMSHAQKRGARILAKFSGGANRNDSHHQTASSEEGTGATFAMKSALERAKIMPHEISYINAHGTGTLNNDLSESRALFNVFGTGIAPFSSTKSYTGHTLAASGGLEAVFAVLNLLHQEIYPTLRWSDPIELVPITTFCDVEKHPVNHVLSNSFGFGGNCTSLIFSKMFDDE